MPRLNVGVTGASGFIGRELVQFLLAHAEVASLRVLYRNSLDENAVIADPLRCDICIGDLQSPSDCAVFCKDLDLIIHLAHCGTPLTSSGDLAGNAQLNLALALNLVSAIRDHGKGCHVVFASSGGTVYGKPAIGNAIPFREDDPCFPFSFYGVQKYAIEHFLRAAAECGWISCTVLRISNPYGVPLSIHRKQGIIGVAMQRAIQGLPIPIYGDLGNVRDYVHIEDVCRAFLAVLIPKPGFRIYNISSGIGVALADLFATMERVTGLPLRLEPVNTDNTSTQLVPWVVVDAARAAHELGWRARITLEEGIKRLYDHIRP